jgi:acetyl esterase/lipase
MRAFKLVACGLLIAATAGAQPVSPAIFTDPPAGLVPPARMTALHIPTHGVQVNGIIYQAAGPGAHPTLVICHGLPGNERNLDLAQAVRRAGWNSVTFNYRGSWGSPGSFRFSQNLEDAEAVLVYLRDPANARLLGVDTSRIVIAGHSMGGWVAVHTASHDHGVAGLITISAADVATQGDWPRAKLLELMADSIGPLAGVTPDSMADEAHALSKGLRFENEASGLTAMPFLALTADDGLASDTDSLVSAVEARGGHQVTAMHVATDHGWSDHRIALEDIVLRWLAARTGAAQATAGSIEVIPNIGFCTGGGSPLLMDILIPARRSRTPTPAVLWIHGGGWNAGDKNAHANAEFLARGGFVAATLSYRLSDAAPFPAAVEDCKCAIRFLRANASTYGIDPGAIGVAGASAGGHLAELLATANEGAGLEGNGGWPQVSSKVQAAVSYFGVSDLTAQFPSDTVPSIVKFMRGTRDEKPDLYRKASPIQYVSKDAPPLLLVHGEKDEGVPFDQSVRMAEAFRRRSLPVDLIALKNGGHDFQQAGSDPLSPSVEVIHQKTVDFFRRYLTP